MTISSTIPTGYGNSPWADLFSTDNVTDMLSKFSLILLVVPSLAGAGMGLKECAVGIASAAEIKIEFTSVMAMLCFLTTPIIYMTLLFFMFNNIKIDMLDKAFIKLTSCAITGAGSYYTAFTVGAMAKHVLVTKVKEKKFAGQFYLGFVFVEFIGLFALIISLLLKMSIKEGVK